MKRSTEFAIIPIVIVLDQLTKAVLKHALELHEYRPVLDGFLSISHVRNRGAAFGILSEAGLPYQGQLLSLVSLLALGAIPAGGELLLPAALPADASLIGFGLHFQSATTKLSNATAIHLHAAGTQVQPAPAGSAFGMPLLVSLFIGGTLTATSIGVTVRVLGDLNRQQSHEGRVVLGAAVLGRLADAAGIVFVYRVCAYLPLIGLLTGFLPDIGRREAS